LNALGLNYTLTAGKQAKADGRTHRNQKKKGPFSAAELKEKGS
jgi:hypothetical protein